MNTYYRVIGVDPGLVDTGVVLLQFDLVKKHVFRSFEVIHKATPQNVVDFINFYVSAPMIVDAKFVEKYRPRHHLATNAAMVTLTNDITKRIGGKQINNTGIKAVVRPKVLKLLALDKFPVASNHQDLKSAGRILLLGMYKDPELNQVITQVVRDTVYNSLTWPISDI